MVGTEPLWPWLLHPDFEIELVAPTVSPYFFIDYLRGIKNCVFSKFSLSDFGPSDDKAYGIYIIVYMHTTPNGFKRGQPTEPVCLVKVGVYLSVCAF